MTKQFKRPKEGLVQPEEDARFIDGQDVEGHGLPITAPPSLSPSRAPGHGGEAVPSDDPDDVEGHRRA